MVWDLTQVFWKDPRITRIDGTGIYLDLVDLYGKLVGKYIILIGGSSHDGQNLWPLNHADRFSSPSRIGLLTPKVQSQKYSLHNLDVFSLVTFLLDC